MSDIRIPVFLTVHATNYVKEYEWLEMDNEHKGCVKSYDAAHPYNIDVQYDHYYIIAKALKHVGYDDYGNFVYECELR